MKQQYVDELIDLLRIPSVSTDEASRGDVKRAAVEMDAEDADGPGGDAGGGVRGIEVQGLRIDIGEDDLVKLVAFIESLGSEQQP